MENQLIISVGREFGSVGHLIAEKLSQLFGIKLYDHNFLDEIAAKHNGDIESIRKFDEAPKLRILSRTVRGYNNSPEDVVTQLQFEYMKERADAGESFVIVGRCSETVLKYHPAMISIFVLGDYDKKLERVKEKYNLSEKEAKSLMKQKDKKRKSYHNYNCDLHWGDSRLYEISINSSRLCVDETVDVLEEYINRRIGK